ncbi:MAG TPA: cation:proton antiporter [Burkholderiaceae bacterium]|jgi:Kef-type K+ transport system membrane component KefB|nr:cation:proton antiporter [Burkholderiaceae bacterium]
MTTFSFFPTIPDTPDLLTAAGLILLAGILGARLATRFLHVPAITGYVLAGLAIGPHGLNLISGTELNTLAPLIILALGMIVFELGRRLDYKWLMREKWLLITALTISISTFLGLFALLTALGVGKLLASMAAAIGMASSPAVTLNVVRESKAEGQVSERMLNIVAIGNSLAFIVFTMCLSALHLEYRADWTTFVLHPLYLTVGSVALGWIAGRLLIHFSHWLGRDSQNQRIALFALIAVTAGAATMMKLSALIALLVFGVASRHYDHRYAVVEPDFAQFSDLMYALLFIYTGAQLELIHLRDLWLIALAFIGTRLAIMLLLGAGFSTPNGLTLRKGTLLGVGLIPMSGVAIVLMQHAAGIYPEFGTRLSALMLSVLAILEILGPICTRFALVASGEVKR